MIDTQIYDSDVKIYFDIKGAIDSMNIIDSHIINKTIMDVTEEYKDKVSPGWKPLFEELLTSYVLKFVSDKLKGQRIQPNIDDIYKCFIICPFESMKVVILGQDPYATPGVATGLAFHCNGSPQPSLKNIIEELKHEEFIDNTNDTDISNWCSQGVLLLNQALTVETDTPGSHSKLWEPITRRILTYISTRKSNVIGLLLGKKAQVFNAFFKYRILAGHPSPLNTGPNKFIGSNVFIECNKLLTSLGSEPIQWNHLKKIEYKNT